MRALTLWEPWASLIALDYKGIETRSWATRYTGPLMIHASKRPVNRAEWNDTIKQVLTPDSWEPRYGQIVCTTTLRECVRFDETCDPSPTERACGDFTPGRYGFVLSAPTYIAPEHAPKVSGQRGLWTPSPALCATVERVLASS